MNPRPSWIDKEFLKEYFLKPVLFAVVLVGVLFLLNQFTYFNFSIGSNNSYNSFEVIGTGKVKAVPNIATTTYTVTETAKTEEEARSAANEKQNQALAEIKEIGIAETDITSNIYVNPNYDPTPLNATEPTQDSLIFPPRQPVQNGYVATITTEVKSSDVEKINQAIDAVTAIGATVGGVSYTFDDQEKYKMEATDKAVANAKQQAENMAEAAGFKLGKILTVRNVDDGYGYPVPYAAERSLALDSAVPQEKTDLQPGQNEITARIGVTFEIKN